MCVQYGMSHVPFYGLIYDSHLLQSHDTLSRVWECIPAVAHGAGDVCSSQTLFHPTPSPIQFSLGQRATRPGHTYHAVYNDPSF